MYPEQQYYTMEILAISQKFRLHESLLLSNGIKKCFQAKKEMMVDVDARAALGAPKSSPG